MADYPTKQKLTWLVVEDDPAIRDVIETMCELWEFDVITFKDGFEATEYLKKDAPLKPLPDIALLDIRMPGPWGHEISARIREHATLKNIGIILMTAYELPGSDEDQYLRASGADHLLYKPLPAMDELLKKIDEVIAKRKQKEPDAKPKQETGTKPKKELETKPKQGSKGKKESEEKTKGFGE